MLKKWYVVSLLALTILISACSSDQNGEYNMNSESAIQTENNEFDENQRKELEETDLNDAASQEDDSEHDEYSAEKLEISKKALEVQEQLQGTWQSESGYQLIFEEDNIHLVGIEFHESKTYIIGEDGLRGFQEGKFEFSVYENLDIFYDHRISLGVEIIQSALIPILELKPDQITVFIDNMTMTFNKQ